MRLLTDADVRALPAAAAVAAVRTALAERGGGRLAAPPRASVPAGDADYVFTVGGLAGDVSGFRAYRTGERPGDQLVAVWRPDGALAGVVVGTELGARRTGAIGAVAADLLARPDAGVLGVVGAGRQAWTQVWALAAVRRLTEVRVASRTPEHREAFAARVAAELGVPARAVAGPAEAVAGADLVVLATTATAPVLAAGDVPAGAHVTTVGPKARGGSETPPELAARAAVLACDSPEQAAAYRDPFFVDPARLTPLADIVAGLAPGRREPGETTLFCSVGLAGSEVLLARALLER